ncbi:MAG: hypothetical protein NVSMB24_14550 [Mucilaginibacter sp.]
MKFSFHKSAIFLGVVLLPFTAFSQTTGTNTNGTNLSAIPTAVPFLNITPDSRSGGLGDAGVAITPDVNANFWNPAKLAFLENNNDISISYSPGLRNLVPYIFLSFLI